MRKIFHFNSPRERYKSDAAVVWCYDHRFSLVFTKLLKKLGVDNHDPIRVAGGAKVLASPSNEADREFVLEQIQISRRLHDTDDVILMLHSDCGAYGGLAAFENDTAREAEHHRQEMHRAAEYLKSKMPDIKVKAYFVDFDGVWEADLDGGAASERIA
ncbi:MAG TPA: carbonic anhydrase [Candidatus Angelobacter sp.]|jgi:carbonic anhydrase|nr:carbonic anhydrase [Candidatus Angelobacter sp.]